MFRQIFREDTVAELCSVCASPIYVGDVAYRIGGDTVCADCVLMGEFIAEHCTERNEISEHMF